jgi:hypothetical protein
MALKPGDPAPDFTLPDQDGNSVSLSGLRGKTVVLYFYPKADGDGARARPTARESQRDGAERYPPLHGPTVAVRGRPAAARRPGATTPVAC